MCRYHLSLANKAISTEFGFSKGDMGLIITTALPAYGAPGMIKVNAAWFAKKERGRVAGIFWFMTNLGRFGIFTLGPALLAGFTFLGMWHVPALHWRWLFWIPSMIATIAAIVMALTVKDTPEEAGFHNVHPEDPRDVSKPEATILSVFMTIISNKVVWIIALAYACTGAVRQGVDQWFPRYMQDVFQTDLKSGQFQFLGFLIPFVASIGSLLSGYVSDTLCKGRSALVAAVLYFMETAIIFGDSHARSANMVVIFFVLISFTANATHSILGTAAAMDVGGKKMAGFASGLIDSFQYFGGSLAGYFLGLMLDKSWNNYFYFMLPSGVIVGLLMCTILGKVDLAKGGH